MKKIDEILASAYTEKDFPAAAYQTEIWAKTRPLEGLSVIEASPIFRNTMTKYRALIAAGARLTIGWREGIIYDVAVMERMREAGVPVVRWDDEPFEVIVSNPPYSIKWAGDDNPLLINDPRFSPAGVLAPKSKADLAFIMHSLSWLATGGTAAIVCFPGIMYRGGAEQKIRKYLIDNNFIDCIIQLPSNLFFGTSIATCIMVLKKGKSDNKTLFIDASNECIKVTNNNKLTQANMDRIVETFAARAEEAHFSHLASYEEIAENDYNLSVSTYVEAEDTREKIDIVKLNAEIAEIVAREQVLREEIDRIVAEIEGE